MNSLDAFVCASGDFAFVPFHGEDPLTSRAEVLPVGRATPFESAIPAVVVYTPITHKVGATVALLWS